MGQSLVPQAVPLGSCVAASCYPLSFGFCLRLPYGTCWEHQTKGTDYSWEAKAPKDGNRQRGNLGLLSRSSGCVEDGGEAGRAKAPLSPAWGLTSGLEGMNRRKPNPAAGGRQEHRPKDARMGQKDV